MEKKKRIFLIAGSVLLAAALVLGLLAALGIHRTEPENPLRQIEKPELNIDEVLLRYDDGAQILDAAFGAGGRGQEGSELPDETQTQQPEQTEQTGEEENQAESEPEQTQPEPAPAQPEPVQQPEAEPVPAPGVLIVTGKDDPGWEDEDGGTSNGDADADNPDPSEDPDTPEDPEQPEQPEEPEEPEQPQEPVSVLTDLRNCTMTQDELTNDILPFYALIENGTEDMYLRVMLQNGQGAQSVLSGSGQNYSANLTIGRNVITILLKQGADTLATLTKTIMYQATLADAKNPEKGDNPPQITTNLDGWDKEITNSNFQLQISALDMNGQYIQANHLRVTLDGKVVADYTGSSVMEYMLYLDKPKSGDYRTFQVTVQAWDDNGNSSYKEYTLTYHFVDEGEVTGTATILIDATAVGLGYIEAPFSYEIKQGEPASYAVAACLESLGYSFSNGGTLDNGFYLSRISGSQIGKYAEPDSELQEIIENDGLTISGSHDKNSLGEFDFTRGSGWTYAVNGYYPGVGLSDYYLNDGETLTLRFTLAWGKDVGCYVGSGTNYCGTWTDGGVTWHHDFENGICTVCSAEDPDNPPAHTHEYGEWTIEREPTCTREGERVRTCQSCQEKEYETIEKLPHEFVNGVCAVCGEEDPDHTHAFTEREETVREATCTEAGEKRLYCVCGQSETEKIPVLGHEYTADASFDWSADYSSCTVSVSCSRCGEQVSQSVHAGESGYTHEHQEATCTRDGSDTYRIHVTLQLGEETKQYDREITVPGEAARGHQFENGFCTVCGDPDPNPVIDPDPEPEPEPTPTPEPTPDPDPWVEPDEEEPEI